MRTWILAIGIMLCAVATTRAEPAPRKPTNSTALEHYTRGARLYGNAAFQDAIEEFKASALVEPAPAIDFNLGVCYRLIGDATQDPATKRENLNKAIWHYERFIKTSPETPARAAEVRKLIEGMRTTIAALPEPSAAGAPVVTPPPSQPQPVDRLAPRAPNHWYDDGVGWALTGSGVASLAVAGGLFVSASGLRNDADATPDQQEQNSLRDSANTRSLIGTTLAIVGGGLMVTGIIKLAIHSDDAASSDDRRSTWSIGVSGRGVGISGRF